MKTIKSILLLLALSLAFASKAELTGEEIKGKVTSVIDGNTLEITVSDTEKYTILLHGNDRTGNRLGDIRVEGVADPKRELIRAGLAWTTDVDPSGELETLKEHAKEQGLGLWSEENPMPPW